MSICGLLTGLTPLNFDEKNPITTIKDFMKTVDKTTNFKLFISACPGFLFFNVLLGYLLVDKK